MKKFFIGFLFITFGTFPSINYEIKAQTNQYQCSNYIIPCGTFLYQIYCVNAGGNGILCQCGLPPFNPCGNNQ